MRVENLCFSRRGQSILEYVVLLAVITLVVVGAVAMIGHRSSTNFANANAMIQQPNGNNSTLPGGTVGQGGVPTGLGGSGGSTTTDQTQDTPRR